MSAQPSFWARRRAAVQAEAQAELRAQELAAEAERAADHAEKDDETLLQEMGLPDPDGLEAGDDFAAFMARDVPRHLQNKALRKLWRSNPVLACVDGLNEYDDDYRAAMLAAEPIKTAYQVGKGMMAHLEEMARQKEAAEQVAEAPDLAEETPESDAQALVEENVATAEPIAEASAPAMDEAVDEAPAPRRMRFRFEGATT
ncbi:DUF3306 domain-containing protein [uncultured Roseobacter sp.]|uniref:DUF3306 domain-containing protein n=1 Tax=uncultured Roseobacter sp. TaxID=114847 RepID=UPI002624941C|nr:DUF3306 domain-containing protein [uncultured Roseobacter sp.]